LPQQRNPVLQFSPAQKLPFLGSTPGEAKRQTENVLVKENLRNTWPKEATCLFPDRRDPG
jgi:hypothetical protein